MVGLGVSFAVGLYVVTGEYRIVLSRGLLRDVCVCVRARARVCVRLCSIDVRIIFE